MILFAVAIVIGSLGILREYPGKNLVAEPLSGKQAGFGTKFRKPSGQTIYVGQTVTAGGVKWTLSNVIRTDQLNQYTEPPTANRGDFLVVNFTVKNTSKYPVTLSDHSIILRDKKGLLNIPSADLNTEYISPKKDLLFTKEGLLAPDETAKGTVNFDLKAFGSHPNPGVVGTKPPASLSDVRIRLGDPATTVKYIHLKP